MTIASTPASFAASAAHNPAAPAPTMSKGSCVSNSAVGGIDDHSHSLPNSRNAADIEKFIAFEWLLTSADICREPARQHSRCQRQERLAKKYSSPGRGV